MSRELPILFNTDMVRAILREIHPKTVTRRRVKGFIPEDAVWGYTMFTPSGYISCRGTFADGYGEKFFKLPCQPGDILYIRETWGTYCENWWETDYYMYRADYPEKASTYEYSDGTICYLPKWRPSIHMPKEAVRIWLKVTGVKVERLQEITDEQATAEGIREYTKDGNIYKYAVTDNWWMEYHRKHSKEFNGTFWQDMPRTARKAYSYLWNSTIKKSDLDHYGWDANPCVWVIEFERCEKPKEK